MQAFNEKCDVLLRFLKDKGEASWDVLFTATAIQKNDGIVSYLKKTKDFVDYSGKGISLTAKGMDFISRTSFVEERDKMQ